MIDHSSFSSVGSLFHARGAATEKGLSLIHQLVRSMLRLPDTTNHAEELKEAM